jgi:DNA damage-inducible protein 1
MLFGLDMLKRHLACIDLGNNCLRINGEEIPFLSEHEIPLVGDEEKPKNSMTEESTHPTSQPSASVQSQKSSQYPEATIKILTDLGISRQEALGSLEACSGNVEMAVSLLFQ